MFVIDKHISYTCTNIDENDPITLKECIENVLEAYHDIRINFHDDNTFMGVNEDCFFTIFKAEPDIAQFVDFDEQISDEIQALEAWWERYASKTNYFSKEEFDKQLAIITVENKNE